MPEGRELAIKEPQKVRGGVLRFLSRLMPQSLQPKEKTQKTQEEQHKENLVSQVVHKVYTDTKQHGFQVIRSVQSSEFEETMTHDVVALRVNETPIYVGITARKSGFTHTGEHTTIEELTFNIHEDIGLANLSEGKERSAMITRTRTSSGELEPIERDHGLFLNSVIGKETSGTTDMTATETISFLTELLQARVDTPATEKLFQKDQTHFQGKSDFVSIAWNGSEPQKSLPITPLSR